MCMLIAPINIFNLFFLSRDGIYNNDIAVIRIRRKGDGSGITFSEKVSPACLPRRAFEEGKECFIAGWGKTQGQIERRSERQRPRNLEIKLSVTTNSGPVVVTSL